SLPHFRITPTAASTQEKFVYTSPAGVSATPITPGQMINLSAYVRCLGPGASGLGFRIRAIWYDESGALISTSDGPAVPVASPDVWERRSRSFTPPANAHFVRMAVVLSGSQSVGVLAEVSAAQITEGPSLHP